MALVLNGTTGVSKVQDGIVTSASIADATIQPIDLAQNMTLMTAQTASGTSVDFTGIPSWVKRITVMFDGVSTNGTSNLLVQLGDSGGINNTGYVSNRGTINNTTVFIINGTTSGLDIASFAAAASVNKGSLILNHISNNKWTSIACISDAGAQNSNSTGSKTLSGALDRIRITTVNGTDTFDAGSINIMYEG